MKLLYKIILIPFCVFSIALADDAASCSWMTQLATEEGANNYSNTNPNSTSTGTYQLTEGAMQACGYLKETGKITSADYGTGEFSNVTWTGKNGVTSRESFMQNKAAQDSCASSYANSSYQALNSSSKSSIGGSIPGTSNTITQSGLVTCAYVAGTTGCNNFLSSGTTGDSSIDANLRARMSSAGPTDSSCLTGTIDNTQYQGTDVNIGAGQANTTGLYCNPDVAKAMGQAGAQAVQNWKVLAGSTGVGYTMVDGSSVNAAAGINGEKTADGTSWFTRMTQNGGYQAMSCVDQLLRSGIMPFFNLPSIGDIMSMLESFACSKMQELFSDVANPINSALYANTNFGTMGGFLPQLGLGSLGGGVQIVEGQGSLVNYEGDYYGTNYSNSSSGNSLYNPFLYGGSSWTGLSSLNGKSNSSNWVNPFNN
jgi:hypothetical protein